MIKASRLQPWQTLTHRSRTVWTIGGSDSSAGAGIQADIQVINGLWAEQDKPAQACSILTTITAQNSHSVSDLLALPIDILEQQWDQLLSDMPPAVIKVSLLANPEQVAWLATKLSDWPADLAKPLVIYDPVAVASSGDALTAEPVLAAVKQHWLAHVDLLTPNTAEVLALTGIALLSSADMPRALDCLQALGVGSVLFKGGHTGTLIDIEQSDQRVLDVWMNGDATRICSSPKLNSKQGHGTGCSLASALAALLAQGYALEDSLAIAHAYIQQGLKHALSHGRGPGPVRHLGWPQRWQDMPATYNSFAELAQPELQFARCPQQLGLYPVVDSIAWLQRLLKAGVRTLQLRIKDLPVATAEPLVQQAVALGRQFHARLFINDYWQLALKHDAYGVHLGQEDLELADLQQIASSGVRLGVSTHGYFEMLRAANLNPSYLALGHIYPTTTKQMPSTPQGLVKLTQQAQLLRDRVPTVAIGGIDWQRAQLVQQSGVGSIAVVRAITQATEVTQTLNGWLELVGSGPAEEQKHAD